MGWQFLNSCLKIFAMNTHNCANLIYVVNSIHKHVHILWTLSLRSLEWYFNIQLKDSGLSYCQNKVEMHDTKFITGNVCMYSVHLCLYMFSFHFSLNCSKNDCYNIQVSSVCMAEMPNSALYFIRYIIFS